MSFGNSGGGTLTLPSPTHPNHIDVQAAVRSLRRSLSRSPSKFHLARTASQSSDHSMTSSHSPNSPSPASPSLRRMASQQFGAFSSQNNAPTTQSVLAQSPLATPFRPSVKLSLRSAKSSAKLNSCNSSASKSATRQRTSPKSPTKRALNVASPCAGNSTPSSSDSSPSGQENSIFRQRSPAPRRSFEKAKSRHSMHLDMSGASLQAIGRFNDSNVSSTTASPLKRSDATMDLDQANFGSGSPKAKRRSYGPSSFGSEFNFEDHGPISPSFDIHDETSREYDWTGSGNKATGEPFASPIAASLPRRHTSLRQSTLQQRQEKKKTSWGRRSGAQHLSQMSNEAASPARTRPRVASDHFMPLSRDSPFSSQGPLPSASTHASNQQTTQPHPLSRTMTASSSNSSIPDDSPTHFPIITERPRAPMNWSKSLPIGALRPTPDDDEQVIGSVSTPDYKHAKPFMGAFASTGLVSKMRNPELEPLVNRGAPVPDTPCKGRVSPFHTFPPLLASNIKSRGKNVRGSLGALGGPSTPFNLADGQTAASNTFGSPGGRPGLFTGFGRRHVRSNSILSLYSDDGRSPVDLNGDTPMATEDAPPTPTRPASFLSQSSSNLDLMVNDSPTANRHIAAPVSAIGKSAWQDDSAASCKYSPSEGPCVDGNIENAVPCEGTSDSAVPIAQGSIPSATLSLPSFRRNRAKRGDVSTPAPLITRTVSSIEIPSVSKRSEFTKHDIITASPLERLEFAESTTPRTPQDIDAAPDASRLSISNPTAGSLFPFPISSRKSLFPPATPTTRSNSTSLFGDRRAITPTNGNTSAQIDASLSSRFANIEFIGKGEFSEVFKVSEKEKPAATPSLGLFSTPTHRSSPSPSLDKVFAVKKLKLPLKGSADRAMRLREVAALEALRGCEHILQLTNSWEELNNLYIQTEYCEEGSLDVFLAQVGIKGKLDDFRVWKIMLELSQGLQHIHNAGFVHLDLKPSNILIDFEGTLKIGDFGMAAALPVIKGPDFEGDREYLAYEVLRGEIDKPADIFSLGLIMLEVAANVKLPDNGATWQALRFGDFSEIPVLTKEDETILRDATGLPIDETIGVMTPDETTENKQLQLRRAATPRSVTRQSGNLFGLGRKNELLQPPNFMQDASDSNSLDNVIKWMLHPEPAQRPTVMQLLELHALQWVGSRQRAGATVFEGNWGPADETLEPMSLDTEMTDV